MYFWVRRLLGQKPPFFDKVGGKENAMRMLDAIIDPWLKEEKLKEDSTVKTRNSK